MQCPRCGAENDAGSRYCGACGANLPRAGQEASERPPLRERLTGLLGTTRRARLVTAATVAAIAVGIAALIVLPSDDDGDEAIPYDSYTQTADKACVETKREIVAAQPRRPKGDLRGFTGFADALVVIAGNWRSSLEDTPAPADRRAKVQALDSALRQVQVEAGGLARVARGGGREAIIARSKRVDSATTGVESAIAALGLRACSQLAIGMGELVRR